jgi:hypothetical protein
VQAAGWINLQIDQPLSGVAGSWVQNQHQAAGVKTLAKGSEPSTQPVLAAAGREFVAGKADGDELKVSCGEGCLGGGVGITRRQVGAAALYADVAVGGAAQFGGQV